MSEDSPRLYWLHVPLKLHSRLRFAGYPVGGGNPEECYREDNPMYPPGMVYEARTLDIMSTDVMEYLHWANDRKTPPHVLVDILNILARTLFRMATYELLHRHKGDLGPSVEEIGRCDLVGRDSLDKADVEHAGLMGCARHELLYKAQMPEKMRAVLEQHSVFDRFKPTWVTGQGGPPGTVQMWYGYLRDLYDTVDRMFPVVDEQDDAEERLIVRTNLRWLHVRLAHALLVHIKWGANWLADLDFDLWEHWQLSDKEAEQRRRGHG